MMWLVMSLIGNMLLSDRFFELMDDMEEIEIGSERYR